MAVVKINAIKVPEGNEAELERRFAARGDSIKDTPGFLGYELLRPDRRGRPLLRLHPLGVRGGVRQLA